MPKTRSAPPESADAVEREAAPSEKGAPQAVQNQQVTLDQAQESAKEPAAPVKRMIVREGNFVLETGNPVDVQKKIEEIIKKQEGYVVSASRSTDSEAIRGGGRVLMTVKVPSEKFEASVEEIRKAADRVVSEKIEGKDITEAYVDIQARLKAKKALEEQFLEIMKQSKSVQDALNVQRELGRVRTEIEQIEGRKRLMENQAAMSKIQISINPPDSVTSSSSGFWYQLRDAFSDGFEGALTFILYLVRVVIALIPFLVLIVLPILLLLRYAWKRYKRNRLARELAKKAEKEAEEAGVTDDFE